MSICFQPKFSFSAGCGKLHSQTYAQVPLLLRPKCCQIGHLFILLHLNHGKIKKIILLPLVKQSFWAFSYTFNQNLQIIAWCLPHVSHFLKVCLQKQWAVLFVIKFVSIMRVNDNYNHISLILAIYRWTLSLLLWQASVYEQVCGSEWYKR